MDHIRKLVFDRLPYYMISGLLSYHQIILKGQIRMDELIDKAWYYMAQIKVAVVIVVLVKNSNAIWPSPYVIAPHQLCPDSRWGISPISPGTITRYP